MERVFAGKEKFRKFEVLIMLFKRILAVVTVILVILAIVLLKNKGRQNQTQQQKVMDDKHKKN